MSSMLSQRNQLAIQSPEFRRIAQEISRRSEWNSISQSWNVQPWVAKHSEASPVPGGPCDIAGIDLETEPGLTTEGAAMTNDDNKPMTEDQATELKPS